MLNSLNRKIITLIGVMVAVVLTVAILFMPIGVKHLAQPENHAEQSVATHYPITKRLRYRLEVRNPQTQVLQNAIVKVLAPLPLTATQYRQALEADLTYIIDIYCVGNDWLVFQIPLLAPLGRKLITITSTLGVAEQPQLQLEVERDLKRFIEAEAYIESNDHQLRKRAEALKLGSVHQTADKVYQAVREHIRYSGPISEPRGARYALLKGRGDCTEYAYLFTALMRANGTPARPVRGVVYPHDALLDPTDLHDWSEYYTEGSWHLVDPLKETQHSKVAYYIAMRRVDYLAPNPETDSERMVWTSTGIDARLIGGKE